MASSDYEWVDDPNKVLISFEVPVSVPKKKVVVNIRETGEIFLGYDRPPMHVVLEGHLYDEIKFRKTTWKMKSSKVVVKIAKKKGESWPELMKQVRKTYYFPLSFLRCCSHFLFCFFLLTFRSKNILLLSSQKMSLLTLHQRGPLS